MQSSINWGNLPKQWQPVRNRVGNKVVVAYRRCHFEFMQFRTTKTMCHDRFTEGQPSQEAHICLDRRTGHPHLYSNA